MNLEWQSIINEGGLISTRPKPVYPNHLGWLKDNPRIGVIKVFQSDTDFALGKIGFDGIVRAKAAGNIDEGYVLLLRANGSGHPTVVKALSVEEVAALLRNEAPREGKWGWFWWIPAELESGPEWAKFEDDAM
jgi:hypothetical protein